MNSFSTSANRPSNRALRAQDNCGMALLALLLLGGAPARDRQKLEFNRDIRPILAENCFACHGPDKAARKADLRLDRRNDAIHAEAIMPGKPEKSLLIERIFAEDAAQ